MSIDKIVAICFCIGGLIANGIGVVIDAITFQHSTISLINLWSTSIGLVVVIVFSIICFKKQIFPFYNLVMLSFFSCVLFPIILFSSPDGVFISYLSLLAPAIGLLHYKFKKFYVVGIISLILYWIIYTVKVHLNINMFSNYMKSNYLHYLGGITASYLFSLIVSTWSTLKLMSFLEKDALTNVFNRYSFEKDLYNKDVTFAIMIDIDHFKRVNDTYGHKVGDLILKSLCDIISIYTSNDLKMYRYGGEEFILLSKQTEADLMTSLKAIWIALNWQFAFKDESFSVSMGIAKKTKTNTKTLVIEADEQLYKAKENGRHQAWYDNKRILYS